MGLTDKQRTALIKKRGEPALTLEFDVFADGQLAMWTHFEHGSSFGEAKKMLVEIRDHLTAFIEDENLCPFRKG